MDPDVAQTLAALERKLADLEHELTSIGGRDSDTGTYVRAAPDAVSAPGAGTVSEVRASGVLVDEAVEQRFSMDAQETVFGEIPATKDERQSSLPQSSSSIDLADLVRFKERMQTTLQGLIDEYSRLLSLKPPTDA